MLPTGCVCVAAMFINGTLGVILKKHTSKVVVAGSKVTLCSANASSQKILRVILFLSVILARLSSKYCSNCWKDGTSLS
jgi:hypothetical protein